ncbi:MAG: DUF2344 domain-containing protein [Lachnospiraceae bacterium]|nr:DUF2344 domain-containing protein [Lachnospiraceae bacterium]
MKVRIKFAKRGNMKFIGHLDIMRYFQKVMRRTEIDIAYSEGFNPHQKMSFAAPLGVGLTSEGEYLDIEANSVTSSYDMIEKMNQTMVDGMQVLSVVALDDNAANAMSLVAAADYLVKYREGYKPECFVDNNVLKVEFNKFINSEAINILKKTKKSEKEVDIKPMIYSTEINDGVICMKLATGSSKNLKPELVMQAFHNANNITLGEFDLEICRLETYGSTLKEETDDVEMILNHLQPLDGFGTEIV